MTLTDYMYQEKTEEENLPALKTVLTYRYYDSKAIYKNCKVRLITPTRNNTEYTKTKKMTITNIKIRKKTNSMDVLRD